MIIQSGRLLCGEDQIRNCRELIQNYSRLVVVTQGEWDRSACYGNYQWLTTNAPSASKGGGTRREVRDFSEAGVAGRTNSAMCSRTLAECPRPNMYIPHIILGNSQTFSDSESSCGKGTWSVPSSQENHILWSGRKVGEQEYKNYYLNSKYIDITRKNSINIAPYWKTKAKFRKHYFQFSPIFLWHCQLLLIHHCY